MKTKDRIAALEKRAAAANWEAHVIYLHEEDNEDEVIDAYFAGIGKSKETAKNVLIVRFIKPKELADNANVETEKKARKFTIPEYKGKDTGIKY